MTGQVLVLCLTGALLLESCAGTPPLATDSEAPRTQGSMHAPADGSAEARAEHLRSAERLAAAGSYAEALRALQAPEALALQRDDPLYPDYAWLRARIASALADAGGARYFAAEALSARREGPEAAAAHQLLGDMGYAAGDHGTAYAHYLEAVNLSADTATLPPRLWLRLAEIALYERAQPETARHFLRSARLQEATSEELAVQRRLARRLQWRTLASAALGLRDANVSALAADGDDLWVGTWDGGVARYSFSRGQATVFRAGAESLTPNTVRCITAVPGRVWVGTYQGLSVYFKATSTWQEVDLFGGGSPKRVEAIAAVGDRLFVGTLGDGLWVLEAEGWRRLSAGGLPGDFVTCLAAVDGELLVGTMNLGVVLLRLADGAMRSLDAVQAGLEARNVTTILPEPLGTVWIGTYGSGLYRWDRVRRRIDSYTRAEGQLADDWVLCAVRAASGLYFGTFGAGLAYRPASISAAEAADFRFLGLRDGLAALDISCAAYLPPYVCFGTLGSGVSLVDESLLDGSLAITGQAKTAVRHEASGQ